MDVAVKKKPCEFTPGLAPLVGPAPFQTDRIKILKRWKFHRTSTPMPVALAPTTLVSHKCSVTV